MTTTISPQVRIIALIGLVAAVGLGASMFMLGGSGSTTQTVAGTPIVHRRHVTLPAKPAATKPKTAKTVQHAHAAPKPVVKPNIVVEHVAAKPARFHGNRVFAQLPRPLQWQLAHHKVVVVSFYNPNSNVDAISVAEAHAGAVAAGAGFLLVSVLDNNVAGILTGLLPGGGLLPDPGVFVYRAPGNIELRIDGFADRDAVAQAATNVLAGQSGPVTTTTATPTQ